MERYDRKREYEQWMQQLETPPASLEYTVQRAQHRAKRRPFRLAGRWLAGAVSFCAAFVILVNVSTPFAHACGRLPFLKELAKAVCLSPSLAAAVENEYVQPVELTAQANGLTLRVEYLIVDQKQVNLFYTLSGEGYGTIQGDPSVSGADGEVLPPYILGGGGWEEDPAALRRSTVDFTEADVPGVLRFTVQARAWRDDPAAQPATERALPADTPVCAEAERQPDAQATLTVTLQFDPKYTAQGRTAALGQTIRLEDVELTLESVEIYPTHLRLNLSQPETAAAWVQSLKFYVQDERGSRYEGVADGVTASGSTDSPLMATQRLESPWFSRAGQLTLCITGAEVQDANSRVKITLSETEPRVEGLPAAWDARLVRAERTGENGQWGLCFAGETASRQLFSSTYWDENGEEHSIRSWGMSADPETQADRAARQWVYLDGDLTGTVWLQPLVTRTVAAQQPVTIPLPMD